MMTKKQITILLAGTFFLQGCTAAMMGTAGALANKAMHEKPALSVSGSSYAAADMLAGQARHMINAQTMIEAAPLKNIGTTETTETLGRVIAEQVASRFVQIGYSVKQVEHGEDMAAMSVAQKPNSSYGGRKGSDHRGNLCGGRGRYSGSSEPVRQQHGTDAGHV